MKRLFSVQVAMFKRQGVAERVGYAVSLLDDYSDKTMDICASFIKYIGDDTCWRA